MSTTEQALAIVGWYDDFDHQHKVKIITRANNSFYPYGNGEQYEFIIWLLKPRDFEHQVVAPCIVNNGYQFYLSMDLMFDYNHHQL